jgi:hypothetical protein
MSIRFVPVATKFHEERQGRFSQHTSNGTDVRQKFLWQAFPIMLHFTADSNVLLFVELFV